MAFDERWQFAGSGPECYERFLVPAIFAPWAALLLEHAQLHGGERVLDAACGTGIVARNASSLLGPASHVVGADINPGMLAVARAAASAEHADVDEWRECSIENLPFADGEFDVVLCQQGLQFAQDKAAAIGELSRVLSDRGRLVISVWRGVEHCPYIAALASALAEHVGAEAGTRMAAPCSFGNGARLRGLLNGAGLNDVQLRIDMLVMRISEPSRFLPAQFAASPVAAQIQALDENARNALFDDIERRLSVYTDDSGWAIPFEAHSIVARR
jgi:SAM-dependent methyltransferase